MEWNCMGAEVNSDDTKLGQLFERARTACEQGISTRDFEPILTELLDYILEHPSCHKQARTLLIRAVSAPDVCWELVAFCLHELRWEDVAQEARTIIFSSPAPSTKAAQLHILAAMNDNWDGRDLFVRFSGNTDT